VANQKLQEALEVENDANDAPSARAGKKQKAVRASSKHMLMLPEVLDIECRGHRFKVLMEGINTQSIWMHLTEENINWLKNEAAGEEAKPRVQRRSGSKRARGDSSRDDDDQEPDNEENPEL
ncbi:unnamed protein product, partial [Symbiodinium sp. CCMP2456]